MKFETNTGPVTVNIPDRERLLFTIEDRLASDRGFALATLNLDHLQKLTSDHAFQRAYAAHDLVVADGNPIVWLSRLAGKPVSLVPGSELVHPLCQIAAQHSAPVSIICGDENTGRLAAQRLREKHKGLETALVIAPGFPFDPEGAEADKIIDRLAQSPTRLCFLAVGAPRQERFAAYAAARLPHIGFASIGAGIDFIAGQQQRAPKAFQAAKMEWFWRMMSNPKRLAPRYAKCALLLPQEAMKAARQRSNASSA